MVKKPIRSKSGITPLMVVLSPKEGMFAFFFVNTSLNQFSRSAATPRINLPCLDEKINSNRGVRLWLKEK